MVMEVFTKENIGISKIMSVIYVNPPSDKRLHTNYGPRLHYYELVYKISGESVTTFNGKIMRNKPGTVEYLSKCEKAEYYVDRKELGDCIDIFFDTDCPMPEESFAIDCSANKNLLSLFHKIYQLWSDKHDGYYYRCMALIYEILAEIQKSYRNYISKDNYKKIEKGIEYLHTHYFEKNVDFYMPASICSISYTYFKKLFMQKFDITPIQYVTKLRLERARELLVTGHYSITEIADACGFENVYYFSTVFKKHFGVSPKNYDIV